MRFIVYMPGNVVWVGICVDPPDALARIGMEHGLASKVRSKLHEHSVLTFHKILTSWRISRMEKTDENIQNSPDPPLSIFYVSRPHPVYIHACGYV